MELASLLRTPTFLFMDDPSYTSTSIPASGSSSSTSSSSASASPCRRGGLGDGPGRVAPWPKPQRGGFSVGGWAKGGRTSLWAGFAPTAAAGLILFAHHAASTNVKPAPSVAAKALRWGVLLLAWIRTTLRPFQMRLEDYPIAMNPNLLARRRGICVCKLLLLSFQAKKWGANLLKT